MNNLISAIEKKHLKNISAVKPGDTVKVHQKVKEGNKERIQIFEGVVIRHKGGNGIESTITVRKIASNVGVERTYPLHSPNIVRIEVIRRAKVRRAYLGYLRGLRGKAARMQEKQFDKLATNVEERDLKPEELAKPEEVVDETPVAETVEEIKEEDTPETPENEEDIENREEVKEEVKTKEQAEAVEKVEEVEEEEKEETSKK